MDKNEIHSRLMDILVPLCQARGLNVWGLELLFPGGGHGTVRIYLDAPQGVGIDECVEVSRHVSLALDVADIIPGAFTLEVSSPGLERPFFSAQQLNAYVGQTIRVRLSAPHEGRKNFKGQLLAVDGPAFTVSDTGHEFVLNWDAVAKAHLVYEYSEPEKPGKH